MSLLSRSGRMVNSRATNFYYSFLFLPREKRRAVEAVYAFARHGDDLADGDLSAQEARRGIAGYREALDRCYAAPQTRDSLPPDLAALADAVERYRIPRW